MEKLTGEDLRVAVSEEMPFAYEELGESPSLSALLRYMKSHLREANFASNTEELRNILLDYVGGDVNESIYEQMNKIDDKESLNERYNVKTLKDVKKLHEAEAPEADRSSITSSNVGELLHKLKEELPYGFLTVTNDAVRYFTEEMDGVHYAKITELLTELQNDSAAFEEVIEDPMCLIDYFTESHFIRSADEVEFFAEKVRKLNLKYFGTEKVDEIDDEFDASCAFTMGLFDENYNVRTLKDVKESHETVDTDNNMKKLQDAAASVKCKLTPGFIEYATEDPEMLDDAIEDELLYCGKTLCNEFPEMIGWEFGEDDELTDMYGSYCVVDTGTDEGKILVQIDGHGRIYNLE